jgi:hypothetical protein
MKSISIWYIQAFAVERKPMDISKVEEILEIPIPFKHAEPNLGRNHMNASSMGNPTFAQIPFEVMSMFTLQR